jgi:indolepyruvate ferredoxin oxidoreductase beta subunit
MKKDIILAGVGGQGILTIATIIGDAATAAGLKLKQAEVHGMSQRGGDVQSNLRLSTGEIYSDLIKKGGADLIISMEPMEALRYLPYLAGDGWIVTSSHTFRNIPDYPEEDALFQELGALPHVATLPIEDVAKDNGLPKSANVVLLGMAAKYIEILSVDQLRQSVVRIFGAKSEKMVEANLKAFELGLAAVNSFN